MDPETRCDAHLARAFAFLGKRWNGVILGSLLQGPAGFAQLRRSIGAISDSMLSDRLAELVAAGLVERRVEAGPPTSVSYQMTDSGLALQTAFAALSEWASTSLTPERCEQANLTGE